MLRRLGGCAVALALLVPTQAMASPSAPAERAQAPTKTRVVELGHKPVRATTAMKVRLVFEGRKGQLVNLARLGVTEQCGGRVLRSRGATVKPWAEGFWRLPRTGTYTAVNKPCREKAPLRLQVRKVVREARLVPDAPVVAGASTRVTHLVPFRVSRDERVSVAGRADRLALIRPDRSITGDIDQDGVPYVVTDPGSPSTLDTPSPTGRYFVEVAPEAKTSLLVTSVLAASLDGPAVNVMAGRYARIAFTGTAGQWVYAELTDARTGAPANQHRLYNVVRGAEEVLPAVQVDCPGEVIGGCSVTQLPAMGTYAISVPITPGDTVDVSVRVRRALRAAPATVNGPVVSYTATTPGQWVVGDLPEVPRDSSGGSGATITLSDTTGSLGSWRLRAVSGYGPCKPGLGVECFNLNAPPNAFTLSPSTMTSPLPWDSFANQAVAVLAVAPAATGSLDLTLTSP